MRAVTIDGGRLVLTERPDPEPGRGELLVRVAAAGINGADLHQVRGAYPAPPGSPPDIPGLGAGRRGRRRRPDVFRFAKGDRVMAVVGGGQAFDHGPFDVILELVGAPNFPANLDALATGGRLLVIGVGAGATVELDLRKLMARRSRVLASNLRSRPLEEKADAARRVEHQALPLLADGRLRIPVAATFPLEQAQEAYDRFAAGGKLGKLVLTT